MVMEDLELVTVIAVEAALRADPEQAVLILEQ